MNEEARECYPRAQRLPLRWGRERHRVELTRPEITASLGMAAPESIRVALLSDFHFDPLREADHIRRCVDLANAERPDLVLLLGDFITRDASVTQELAALLGELSAPGGVFGVLGNHDYWSAPDEVTAAIEDAGIQMLRNELANVSIGSGGQQLLVAGLESIWGGKPEPSILDNVPDGAQVLLAHHEPDAIDQLSPERRAKVALQVSGHTHGGQICAPGGRPICRAAWGRRYTKGHYHLDDTQLYVTRGVGTISFHARHFCRPEVTMLEIRNSA